MYKLLVILRDFPVIVWVGNDPTVGSLGEELEVEKNMKRGKNGFGFGCKRMYEMRKTTNLQTCMYLTGMWRCLTMKNQRCFGVEKNGRRRACEALESRNDADEALDKICHLARRQDGHLNQT